MKIKTLAIAAFLSCPMTTFAQIEEVKETPEEVVTIPQGPAKGKIFKVIDDMPRFQSDECETLSKAQRTSCSQRAMLQFIYNNIKYPKKAVRKKVEGTVVINFVVTATGEIQNAKIVREIGGGCGEEALRVVELMPNWVPGTKSNRPVAVYFNIPIKFKL